MCVLNICYCDNGTPKNGENCQTDQAHDCQVCNDSYHLEGNLCKQHTCTCSNGIAAGPYNWTSDRLFNTNFNTETGYIIDSEVRAWQNYKLEFQLTFNDFGPSTKWRRLINLGAYTAGHRYPTVFLQKDSDKNLYVGTWNSAYDDGVSYNGPLHVRDNIPMTWTTGVPYNFRIEQNLADITVYMDDTELISWNTAVYIPDNNEGEKHNLATGYPTDVNPDYIGYADAVLENVIYTQTSIDVYCDVDNTTVCQSCNEGYHLDENSICIKTCEPTYHLDENDTCQPNTGCTCTNGYRAGPNSSDELVQTVEGQFNTLSDTDTVMHRNLSTFPSYELTFDLIFHDWGQTDTHRRLFKIGYEEPGITDKKEKNFYRFPALAMIRHFDNHLRIDTTDRAWDPDHLNHPDFVANTPAAFRDKHDYTAGTLQLDTTYNIKYIQNRADLEFYIDDNLILTSNTAKFVLDDFFGDNFNIYLGYHTQIQNHASNGHVNATISNFSYTQTNIRAFCEVDNTETCQNCLTHVVDPDTNFLLAECLYFYLNSGFLTSEWWFWGLKPM